MTELFLEQQRGKMSEKQFMKKKVFILSAVLVVYGSIECMNNGVPHHTTHSLQVHSNPFLLGLLKVLTFGCFIPAHGFGTGWDGVIDEKECRRVCDSSRGKEKNEIECSRCMDEARDIKILKELSCSGDVTSTREKERLVLLKNKFKKHEQDLENRMKQCDEKGLDEQGYRRCMFNLADGALTVHRQSFWQARKKRGNRVADKQYYELYKKIKDHKDGHSKTRFLNDTSCSM